MKNIHLLPTDKSSRLYYHCLSKTLMLWHLKSGIRKSPSFSPQNIYITNDEEIKDGEYGICLNLVREGFKSHQAVFKMDAEQRQAMNELGGQKKAEVLKVILTTDPDLIKDGVQAIDDEFLEWFVKNPTCEVVNAYFYKGIETGHYYRIDIPKEEPKQETLEEFAYKYAEMYRCPATNENEYCKHDIISAVNNGAKWQQQQNKNLYSEEDMTKYALYILNNTVITPKEWFEQFKKK